MQRNLGVIVSPFLRNSRMLPALMPKRALRAASICLLQKCGGEGKLSPKMKNLMKKFQKNDGLPVFLKGGPMDVLLYRFTWVLCIIGLVGNIHLYFGYILA